MNESIFEPYKKHYLLVTFTPDAFRYRERRKNGELKIWKISPLKKYFATKFRAKYKIFFKAHDIKRTLKFGIYYLPDLQTGQQFKEFVAVLDKEILFDLEKSLERAKKKKDIEKIESIEKKIKYLQKHWPENKPLAEILQGWCC